MAKRYWLMKSEPSVYSIDHLEKDGTTYWDGIRNYRARNFMRDEMKSGDLVLYYHSNADPIGVAGIAQVCKESHPDPTAFDKKSKYYDPKSSKDEPTWWLVDIEFVEKFGGVVTLEELKQNPALADMMVTKRGMRLSIQPVEPEHFRTVRKMGRKK